MKILLLLLALSITAAAQNVYDITAFGGTVTGPVVGARPLNMSSTVVAVYENGTFIMESGLLTGTTGRNGGSLQVGSTFGPGGGFTATLADLGLVFSGIFDAGATWVVVTAANGKHHYSFTGTARDAAGNTSNVVMSTTDAASVSCFWSGAEDVLMMQAHVVTQ